MKSKKTCTLDYLKWVAVFASDIYHRKEDCGFDVINLLVSDR